MENNQNHAAEQTPVAEEASVNTNAAACERPALPVLPESENVVAGIVGAFLFSLLGALLWFIVYQFGVIASICGLVTVVCAIHGYKLFAKSSSLKGVVIAVIISIIMIAVAEYASFAYELYKLYKQTYDITFFDAFRAGFSFLSEGKISGALIRDLLIGYALGAVGSFSYIKNAVKANRVKKQQDLTQTLQHNND